MCSLWQKAKWSGVSGTATYSQSGDGDFVCLLHRGEVEGGEAARSHGKAGCGVLGGAGLEFHGFLELPVKFLVEMQRLLKVIHQGGPPPVEGWLLSKGSGEFLFFLHFFFFSTRIISHWFDRKFAAISI